ncbi:esterase/lipase/thioesterase domain-containing protein [Heterostelium album PN500]|uniref:Esterase/lipase/thioesterase domain-containing protein n=1 Tax=Heterostelium pallidum (strain ATCC 26659 / Pp 5 / PN500) TaxID=670386 RepID=D3BR91_HETP5|nr:esterase/lipase/thioesterase domain-containing protein [Heterostelium album PN500]EFA75923.1 esterase/lipase/thioesterase domain-containing protein [Heterostelium album PN500]|eukprot:XP_020428057.1 esterase/lipase/thioesterase domain-containing protein [Heterostelium album PN500]
MEPIIEVTSEATAATPKVKIVLVHGSWCDANIWRKVLARLAKKNEVYAVQLPLTSLTDDVEALRRLVERIDGKVLLVGYSYGGFVITEAVPKLDNKVVGLLYVNGIIPSEGQNLDAALGGNLQFPPDGLMLKDNYGNLWLNPKLFKTVLAQDTTDEDSTVWLQSQKPLGLKCVYEHVTTLGYKNLPCWYQISDEDRILPLVAQNAMSTMVNAKVVHLPSSHASILSHDKQVSTFIKEAARELSKQL